jgi:hypothetical protein
MAELLCNVILLIINWLLIPSVACWFTLVYWNQIFDGTNSWWKILWLGGCEILVSDLL